MKTASLIIGVVTIIGMLIALIPCLGWLNWLNVPIAVVGLILGIIDYNDNRYATPANNNYNGDFPPAKQSAPIGAILCGIAVAIGIMRLIVGFGVI